MLMKNVNGLDVPLSAEDIAQMEADAAAQAAPALPNLTAVQLRLGLLALGMNAAQVEAAIAAMPGTEAEREAVRIQWEYETSFRRTNPLVVMLAASLGMSEAQIDAAWLQAATL